MCEDMTARDFCLSMGADYIEELAQDLKERADKCEWILRTALAIGPSEDATDPDTVQRAFERAESETPGLDAQKVSDLFRTMRLARRAAAGVLHPEAYTAPKGWGSADPYELAERLIVILE